MNESILEILKEYLKNRFQSKIEIENFHSLSGGACQDNYSLDLKVLEGKESGEYKLVLRKDKGASLVASLNRVDEFSTALLAWQRGVKTPRPMWLEKDSSILGSPFYFMERIQGNADGRYLVKHPSLQNVRESIGRDLALQLVQIHSIQPSDAEPELREVLWKNGGNPLASSNLALHLVQSLRMELASHKEGYPAMELVLNWLEKNAPLTEKPVLIHGDFRTGNFMVSTKGLEGIVDWEFAHWGDRYEDLTWLCLRDWRFGKIKKEVGGFMERNCFYQIYEENAGVQLDPSLVKYWEVMGNLRWAIGCLGQAERHLSGKDKGIELASIGRRACEMEWEAIRLIENAR